MHEQYATTGAAGPPDPSATLAEVQGVSKRFGATHALDQVSLSVAEGESRALVGRNGAGKSTIVSILTGLVRADQGEVRFLGRPAPKLGDRDAWRQRVACVYQKSTLLPDLTVAENLFMNAHPRGPLGLVSWRQLRARAEELLATWKIDIDPGAESRRLRVEDRQQVEIARALASGSRFLILDEPTARLEGPAIRRLFEQIEGMRRAGVSILYISHHLDEIYEICNTVTVVRDGRVVHAGDVAGLPKAELVEAMVGREGETDQVTRSDRRKRSAGATAQTDGDETLRVEALAVDGWCSDVSFGMRPGEIVGLAGLAGSGKAQVAEAIAGLRKPNAGQVLVSGEPVPAGDVRTAIEHGVGYVPQDRHAEGFAPNLSIEENLTLTRLGRLGRFGFVSPRVRRRLARELMASLEVVASGPDQLVSELSGGNQQKVVVGRALLTHPSVLVVVSPTAGVDVASKEALFGALKSGEHAVLVVSDELDELSHCDRVLVMFDGQLTEELETWREHELVAAMEGVEER